LLNKKNSLIAIHSKIYHSVIDTLSKKLTSAKPRRNLQVVYPKDYTLILLRSALTPRESKNKQAARQFLTYLLSERGQSHMTKTTGLLSPKSQSKLNQSNSKPIRLDTGLLVYLDRLKRKRFLREWNKALVQ
jgi:iron(III) transport system substrate-binding protein